LPEKLPINQTKPILKMTGCIFCRARDHTKSFCFHATTLLKQQEINTFITSTYSASQRNNLTQDEFYICIKTILNDKFTINHLKMSIEDFKRKLNNTTSIDGNKPVIIRRLTDLACQFYNYTFAPFSEGHVITPYEFSTGIMLVTREILRPHVGNLQPPAAATRLTDQNMQQRIESFPPRTQESYQARAPQPVRPVSVPAPQPVQQQRQQAHLRIGELSMVVTLPVNLESRQRIISNINNLNTLHNTFLSQQMNPQYRVHKTDKDCHDSAECAVCFNTLNNETYVYLGCSHEFCKNCIKECLNRTNMRKCPLCRAPITDVHTQTPNVSYSI
jgi:hypothetical protein